LPWLFTEGRLLHKSGRKNWTDNNLPINQLMKNLIVILFLSFSLGTFCNAFPVVEPDSTFKQVDVTKDFFYMDLPAVAEESSGLIFWRDLLWTHNDGGGEAAIYGIDPVSGTIRQTVIVNGAKNFDWEDITQDAGYIYIGDFGNNFGNRRPLSVYKISKGGIPFDKKDVIVSAQKSDFDYADQDSYKKRRHAHNFDCEAFFAFEKKLYLFTKNWADQKTRLYRMPVKKGKYDISPIETFEAGGLITGADISPSGKRVALIGYIDYESFMWLFWDFEGDDFFGGKKIRVNLTEMIFVQTEAITFTTEDDLFFSCEASAGPPSLFKAGFNELINSEPASDVPAAGQIVIPGKVKQTDNFELIVPFELISDVEIVVELRTTGWKLVDQKPADKPSTKQTTVTFNIEGLKPGPYFLNFMPKNNSADGPVIDSEEKPMVKKIKIIP
jgi:hypothetical protein